MQYTNILRIQYDYLVSELSMLCLLIGHRFRGTYVINENEDFFEVSDARYCKHCGAVHAHTVAT
jgi:hypothetical protein